MKSNIYTMTGDAGTTALIGGTRVSKDDIRVEAYGNIDELNSYIGLLAHNSKLDHDDLPKIIYRIQNKLFNIGAYLANPEADKATGLYLADVLELESKIDEMDAELPPMRGFVLPGGSRLSALSDICRTVTRRAERHVIALGHAASQDIDPLVLQYLNRLSDFFFVLSRYNNVSTQTEEILWDKNL